MAVHFAQDASGLQKVFLKLNSPVVTAPPVSFFAWAKPDSVGADGHCIAAVSRFPPQSFAENVFMMLMAGESTQQRANISNQSIIALTRAFADSTYTTGSWQSFGGVASSTSSMKAYYNGVPGPENTNAYTFAPNATVTLIGAHPSGATGYQRDYNGCLCHVAIWNVALTDDDMELLAAGTPPDQVKAGNLVCYLKMETAATVAVNEVGTDFTVVNDGVGSSALTDCPDGPNLIGEEETGEEDECGFEDEADAAGPCDVTWPECVLVPSRIQVDVFAPSVSPGRSFNGFEQLIQPDAGHWRIVFHEVPIRTRTHALQWREIESKLQGRNGTVCVPVYEGKLSAEEIAATVVNDRPIGTTQIEIEQTAGASLRPGMDFSHGEWLYRITRVISEETGELYTVAIWPPLRAAIEVDDELDFNTPRVRCRLERDDSMDVNLELLRFARPSVVFVEDV